MEHRNDTRHADPCQIIQTMLFGNKQVPTSDLICMGSRFVIDLFTGYMKLGSNILRWLPVVILCNRYKNRQKAEAKTCTPRVTKCFGYQQAASPNGGGAQMALNPKKMLCDQPKGIATGEPTRTNLSLRYRLDTGVGSKIIFLNYTKIAQHFQYLLGCNFCISILKLMLFQLLRFSMQFL